MSLATGTATTAEIRTMAEAVHKLNVMLTQYLDGAASATNVGRFTNAQIDTQITAVSSAITAVNAS